jgi:hypothetical protein
MTACDARARLIRLQAERLTAVEAGVRDPSPYMTRLSEAIADAREEYTRTAVTEIAALRTDLGNPVVGQ